MWGQYTINAKTAPPDAAVGDEVTLWLNEENMVIDHHGKHKTRQGASADFRQTVKTKPIAEGTQIVVELNEGGTVIDLRKTE